MIHRYSGIGQTTRLKGAAGLGGHLEQLDAKAPDLRSRIVGWLEVARRTPALWALATITLAGVVLRVFFLLRYQTALLGFPDSAVYAADAAKGLFFLSLRVSGYAIFLRTLHAISPDLILVVVVQHALGIVSGLLLFESVRRSRARLGLGLVPAAVVMLGGSELMLEHAVLSDSLFIFLVDLAVWCIVRSWNGGLWWALGAGVSLGCATIDRTVGLMLLPVMLLCLLFAPAATVLARGTDGPPRGARASSVPRLVRGFRIRRPLAYWRLARLLAGIVGASMVILAFLSAHKHDTGEWGFASTSNFDLYGRVAPWANCSKFTPPPGTAKLCIHTPVSQRLGTEHWEFTWASPADVAYDGPEAPNKDENNQLGAFALAAIEGQPLTYLEYVGRDLVRVVDPSFPTSPYKKIGNGDYGLTPGELLDEYFNASNVRAVDASVKGYYRSPGKGAGNIDILKSWDRATRIEGPLMAVVLMLALIAPFLAKGLPRRFAILCGLTSAVLIVGPILVVDYDWRFMIPVFGPLTAGAAIGGFEVCRRVASMYSKLRHRPGVLRVA